MGTMTSQATDREQSLESLLAKANTMEDLQELDHELDRRLAGFSTASLQALKAKVQRKQVEVAEREVRDTRQLEQEVADLAAQLGPLYDEYVRQADELMSTGQTLQLVREHYVRSWRKAKELGVEDLPQLVPSLQVRAGADRELSVKLDVLRHVTMSQGL
jgi:hypothetical protein